MLYLFLFILILPLIQCLEPLSMGIVGAGLSALGYKNFDFVKTQTYCRFHSCCNDEYVPANIIGLQETLKSNLFGQHIVEQYMVSALKTHYNNLDNSKKPLVMSFHGVIGTGKNFVAENIANSIYKNGMNSEYVHFYAGRSNFPLDRLAQQYSSDLKDAILEAVKKCQRSLFIFDEVDKIPRGVFTSITSLLDHHSQVDGVDLRKSVFIFLTNTGGVEISQVLDEHYKNSEDGWREKSNLHHFEKYAEAAAYNMDGGLQKSGPIETSVIDHYIPFLPLEKRHVEKCIQSEFKKLGHWPNDSQIQEVLKYISFDGRFSTTGCKRIGKKVAALIN